MTEKRKRIKKAYGFYPQMKAEGIAFSEEKSVSVVIGTNPGWQNGVLVVEDELFVSEDRGIQEVGTGTYCCGKRL